MIGEDFSMFFIKKSSLEANKENEFIFENKILMLTPEAKEQDAMLGIYIPGKDISSIIQGPINNRLVDVFIKNLQKSESVTLWEKEINELFSSIATSPLSSTKDAHNKLWNLFCNLSYVSRSTNNEKIMNNILAISERLQGKVNLHNITHPQTKISEHFCNNLSGLIYNSNLMLHLIKERQKSELFKHIKPRYK